VDLDEEQTRLLLDEIPSGKYKLPPRVWKKAGKTYTKERDPENLMTALAVYRLVANSPALLDSADEKAFLSAHLSPKEEALLDLLDGDLAGEKVIVYTSFRTHIDRLEALTRKGKFTRRKFLRVTGAEDATERRVAARKFQEPDGDHDLIFINQAGIEGINLQQAAHMICLDLPWSWGNLLQLVGRMLRIASPHAACTLHLLPARGSIDEFTISTLKSKKGVFEMILGDSHSAGLLDDKTVFDMESGMEQAGGDEDFRQAAMAHAKKTGMMVYLKGEALEEAAQQKGHYTMAKPKRPKRNDADEGLEDMYQRWE
jgi:SNF2 family DNA or RNA helicase